MPSQYVNLMPKDQDLGCQRSSRPEHPDQRRPNKAARFPHRTEALRDSAPAVSLIRFTTGTRVKFKAETDYYPFRMKDTLPVVKRAVAAVSSIGGTPTIRAANGGLDANWMVRHGIPTVTFGAGQNEAHTIDEWINLDEYDRACTLAIRLATMG